MRKKDFGSNKGFSLIELIIVIAIMAVLVAVIAPVLLKYLEKSRVASDQSLLNTISAAITYAAMDPAVMDDPASEAYIGSFVATPALLEDIPTDTAFYRQVIDTLGWDDLSQGTYITYLRSEHTGGSHIYMQYKGSADNPIAFWITNTDSSGEKDTSESVTDSYLNVNKCIVIR